jgi:hypothetical protein
MKQNFDKCSICVNSLRFTLVLDLELEKRSICFRIRCVSNPDQHGFTLNCTVYSRSGVVHIFNAVNSWIRFETMAQEIIKVMESVPDAVFLINSLLIRYHTVNGSLRFYQWIKE